MCGLFGAVGNSIMGKEKDRVRELGMISAFRGLDSTGLVCLHNHKNKGLRYHSQKDTLSSPEFFMYPDYKALFNFDNTKAFIGHCRAATIGKINVVNAHPHVSKHIVGVHNGTIDKFRPSSVDGPSDSATLFDKIANGDLATVLQEVHDCDGAYAIVFLDTRDSSINIIRNEKRPLYLAHSPGMVTYWASEKPMFEFVFKREQYGPSIHEPYLIQPHKLYKFQTYKLGKEAAPTEIIDMTPKARVFLPAVVAKGGRAERFRNQRELDLAIAYGEIDPAEDAEPWYSQFPGAGTPGNTSVPSVTPTVKEITASLKADTEKKLRDEVPFTPGASVFGGYFKGYNSRHLKYKEVRELLNKGCACCEVVPDIQEHVWWYRPDMFICDDCTGDEFFQNFANNGQMFEGHWVHHGDQKKADDKAS